MQKTILALAAGAMLASFNASAEDGNWMVRVRAVHVSWTDEASAVPALLVPQDGIHLAHTTIPEVDISYFFTRNIAAELILTYPQKHEIHIPSSAVGRPVNAGSLKELPPTLLLQYHFSPDSTTYRPYVGAGFNYTTFSDVDLAPLNAITGGNNTIDRTSTGAALQAGLDYKVGANSYINFDLKKVYIKTDLTNSALGKLSTIKGNPLLIGIGYGMKF